MRYIIIKGLINLLLIIFPILTGTMLYFQKPTLSYLFLGLAGVSGAVKIFFPSHKIPLIRQQVRGNLEAVYSLLKFRKSDDVRMTLYVPGRIRRDMLKQAIPYIPSGRYGSCKRGINIAKGVVGCCYRTNESVFHQLKPRANFKRHTVMRWGFTEREVEKLQQDRKSYLAVPVRNTQGNVKAVICLDSFGRNVFNPGVGTVLLTVCEALAKLV